MARKGDYVSLASPPKASQNLPSLPSAPPGVGAFGHLQGHRWPLRHARPRACGRTCAPRRCPGAEASPSSPAALLFFFKATARDSWRQLALDLAGAVLSRPFLETGLFRPRSSCPPSGARSFLGRKLAQARPPSGPSQACSWPLELEAGGEGVPSWREPLAALPRALAPSVPPFLEARLYPPHRPPALPLGRPGAHFPVERLYFPAIYKPCLGRPQAHDLQARRSGCCHPGCHLRQAGALFAG